MTIDGPDLIRRNQTLRKIIRNCTHLIDVAITRDSPIADVAVLDDRIVFRCVFLCPP